EILLVLQTLSCGSKSDPVVVILIHLLHGLDENDEHARASGQPGRSLDCGGERHSGGKGHGRKLEYLVDPLVIAAATVVPRNLTLESRHRHFVGHVGALPAAGELVVA